MGVDVNIQPRLTQSSVVESGGQRTHVRGRLRFSRKRPASSSVIYSLGDAPSFAFAR